MKCRDCNGQIVKVPHANNGVGHVSKTDWVDHPHKARKPVKPVKVTPPTS